MVITDKILNSAFSLFMKYGIKSVSMDDLARKLGISKKTIYTVIDNKKELVEKVIRAFLKQEEKDVSKIIKNSTDSIDEMVNIGRHLLQFMREMKPSLVYDLQKYHPRVWSIVETEHFKFIDKVVKSNIEKGIRSKLYRPEVNADIITKLYISKSRELVNEETFPNKHYNKADLFEQFFTYHLYGIVSDKGRTLLHSKNLI